MGGPTPDIPDRNRVNFSWLVKLRWSSIAGQIATVLAVVWLVEVPVPVVPLFVLVAIEAGSNLLCARWLASARRVHQGHLAGVMAFDVLLLTGLLFFTGGPDNPFRFLYLVNIALAAVALHAHWTWALVGWSLFCLGVLPLTSFHELPLAPGASREEVLQLGAWVAFGVAAMFIVHFLWRVTRALSEQERELSLVRDREQRQAQLASLATVAAGAAHELATPLGTIALVAGELSRGPVRENPTALEDVRLIQGQVARCRAILDQMGAGAGKSDEQALEEVTVDELLPLALDSVRDRPGVRRVIDDVTARTRLFVPPLALAQALRSLITNAQDAGDHWPVTLRVEREGAHVRIQVVDQGHGMSEEQLARVGEPFYTTKDPGRGMGLGVYLARAVVERLDGELSIRSNKGQGTVSEIRLPVAQPHAEDKDHGTGTIASIG